MGAFANAVRRYGAFECDVRWSSDAVPVVVHDASLARTHGVPRRVGACTVAELDELGVPRLADVLDAFERDATVVLDLKEDPRAVVRWLDRRRRVANRVVLLLWEDGVRVPPRWSAWRVRYNRFPATADGHAGVACRFSGSAVNRACIERALNAGLHVNMYALRTAQSKKMQRLYADVPQCSFTV